MTREVALKTSSKFSHDKKRNYQEKKELYNKQKLMEKLNSKAHERSHSHLLKNEQNLHPSWQAKLIQKRKMEELSSVKNTKMVFSDSE